MPLSEDEWPISILASKMQGLKRLNRHGACIVKATSEYEAFGKATAIAKNIYPEADGWEQHHVTVNTFKGPVEPENAKVDN